MLYFFGEESGYYGLVLEDVGYTMEDIFTFGDVKNSAGLAATFGIQMVSSFLTSLTHHS